MDTIKLSENGNYIGPLKATIPYSFLEKIAIFLKLAWPNTSFSVLSKLADNTESLFMNVKGMTDKIPI